jgi:hypothetical protein
MGELGSQGLNWVIGKVAQAFQVGHMDQVDQVGQVGQVSQFIQQGGVGHLRQVGKWVRRVRKAPWVTSEPHGCVRWVR